jgi:hypothetical protein
MMMVSSIAVSASAAGSVQLTAITAENVTVAASTYTGKAQTPAVTVTVNGKTLVAGTDYTVTAASQTNAGTYAYTIKGIGHYEGTVDGTWTIGQATRTKAVSVTPASKTVKKATVKKKAVTFSVKAATTAKVTYKSSSSKVTVSKNGKVTVKKGTKAGTYKITVTVTSKNYKTVTKTIKIKVK